MAKHEYVTLVDDLNGKEDAATVEFGIDGEHFEIDLDDDNAAALRAIFEPYITHARILPKRGRPRTKKKGTKVKGESNYSREESKRIRERARAAGISVQKRGRIPQEVSDQFNDAAVAPVPVTRVNAPKKRITSLSDGTRVEVDKPAPAKKRSRKKAETEAEFSNA